MNNSVAELLALLDLEPLEVNIYRGQNRNIGTGRVFGGQVFAQALVAAQRTVPVERDAHSVHGYFLRPGDLAVPIMYIVDRPRDGGSFTSRRVTAIQHGEAIFHLSASFHVSEPGLDHQTPMPHVPAAESLAPELDVIREMADRIPEPLRPILTQDRPIDFRPVQPHDPFQGEKRATQGCDPGEKTQQGTHAHRHLTEGNDQTDGRSDREEQAQQPVHRTGVDGTFHLGVDRSGTGTVEEVRVRELLQTGIEERDAKEKTQRHQGPTRPDLPTVVADNLSHAGRAL